MYVYYMLSAIPSMQKYLWWKRYLTIMQIVSSFFLIFLMDLIIIIFIYFLLLLVHVESRFNSYSFFATLFNFNFNRTAIFQSSSELCCHSTLLSSPTCSHLSTLNHTIKTLKSLKTLSKGRKLCTMKTATSFRMVKRTLKLNKNGFRSRFHVLFFPLFNHFYSYAILIVPFTSYESFSLFLIKISL